MTPDENYSRHASDEEASLTPAASSASQFPLKLHDMLDQAEAEGYQHVVGWLPNGEGFQIHDPEAMLPILQQCGFNQSKWKSFLRQLQNYGFRREIRGPNKGKCTHDLFIRNRRDLSLSMRRIKRSSSNDNLAGAKKRGSRENLTRASSTGSNSSFNGSFNSSFNSSLNSSFTSQHSVLSAASLGLGGLGSRTSLRNLNAPPQTSSSGSNLRNVTFDHIQPGVNPLLGRLSGNGNGNHFMPSSINNNNSSNTQQLVWEIQQELANLSTSSLVSPLKQQQQYNPELKPNFQPNSNFNSMQYPSTITTSSPAENFDLEPLDFRAKPQVDDALSSLVEGIHFEDSQSSATSTDLVANLFLREASLEETYGEINDNESPPGGGRGDGVQTAI